jgi:transposase
VAARLIEGGLPTEATVAHVLVAKYADHSPLYRQAQIYERQGLRLDRSTLADWVGRAAFHLRPVHERILAHLKSSTKLFADETTAPALDARDDRPLGGSDPPAVAYVNAPDRKASNRGLPSRLAQQASKRGRLRGESGKVTVALSSDHLRAGLRSPEQSFSTSSPLAGASA